MYQPLPPRRSLAARPGLTLIELVVVMVILAAVAGIVLPLLPNMVGRAHTTTGATNIAEAAKAIQTYEAIHLAYPTNFDSLTLTPAGTGTLPTFLPATTDLNVTALSDDTADALANAGVNSVRTMVASGTNWSPTFYPYADADTDGIPDATPIADTVNLATLKTTTAARLGLANPLTTTYVVLGLGGYTSMQGKSLQEAPVHFGDSAADAPTNVYARYGVVFQVTDGSGAALEKARLAQIVAFHDDAIIGLNEHMKEYFETVKN
jgi:prepilin-type N-terminal cleavage/methylation domain-containing protein